MSTYEHFQEARRAEALPSQSNVGPCLTCRYWDVERERPAQMQDQIAMCCQPQLKPYALLVSGSSACNKWAEQPGLSTETNQYAEQSAG